MSSRITCFDFLFFFSVCMFGIVCGKCANVHFRKHAIICSRVVIMKARISSFGYVVVPWVYVIVLIFGNTH